MGWRLIQWHVLLDVLFSSFKWKPVNWFVLQIGSFFSIWVGNWRLGVILWKSFLSILRNKLLIHLTLIDRLTRNRLNGLCYNLSDWFYESGQLALNELRKIKNLLYNFNFRFLPETAIKNLSKVLSLCCCRKCCLRKRNNWQYLSGQRTM